MDMQPNLIGKYIAANVDGSVNNDRASGKWYTSLISKSNGVGSDDKIDFIYKGKNGSFYKDAILNKTNFYIICNSYDEAEKICQSRNRLIQGQREDKRLISSRGRYM